MGWIGTKGQLLHYLAVVGADRDEKGDFKVDGAISTFMGLQGDDADVVVAADAVYLVGGERKALAAGLSSTSYGLAIKVFA
jgi:hypothetical protein